MYSISSDQCSSKFQDSISISNKTEINSIKKPDRLVLLKEEISVDFENHRKHRSKPVAKFRISFKYSR